MKTKNYVYITKCVRKDMSSGFDRSFVYPTAGFVEAPDWSSTAECGNGLHGFLWGEGDGGYGEYSSEYVWLLIKVDPAEGLVDLQAKVKFRRGEVVQAGTYREIAAAILPLLPTDRPYRVIGLEKTVGDDVVVVGGDRCTLTGGNCSTVIGGHHSTVTGGYNSTVTGGDRSTVTGGENSTVTGGYYSNVTGGYNSTVTGGGGAVLILDYCDGNRWVKKVAVVGENDVEPDVPYVLGKDGNFVKKGVL